MPQKSFALITAAGNSSRMGGNKKELIELKNKPLLIYTITPFDNSDIIDRIYITYTAGKKEDFLSVINSAGFSKKIILIEGGESRQQSVYRGLLAMEKENPDCVLIHDGARPAVSGEVIKSVFESVKENGACAPAVSLVDSIKEIDDRNRISGHPDRNRYRGIQTPQGFYFKNILEAHRKASSDSRIYTDDTEIYSRYAGDVFTVQGSENNRKITYKNDIDFFEKELGGSRMIRIGQGYDLHRLEEGEYLILGGVKVPSDKKASAHSDGDVLIHAVIDSLLGAAAEGDIGALFPPSDPAYKDISSRLLLKKVVSLIKSRGFSISNIDTTVVLEKPRLREYIDRIRKNLAEDLEADLDRISVKAKTNEKCDAAGRREAVEAFASVIITG